MKIKIDKKGYLWIERPGGWKMQECRPGGGNVLHVPRKYGPTYEEIQYGLCGDSCPLFGEPTLRRDFQTNAEDSLEVCQKILYGEIIDERQKGGQDEK